MTASQVSIRTDRFWFVLIIVTSVAFALGLAAGIGLTQAKTGTTTAIGWPRTASSSADVGGARNIRSDAARLTLDGQVPIVNSATGFVTGLTGSFAGVAQNSRSNAARLTLDGQVPIVNSATGFVTGRTGSFAGVAQNK